MISFNLKSSLGIALICFVAGFCIALLLVGSCNSGAKRKEVAHTAMLKAQADSLHAYYQNNIAAIQASNDQLILELNVAKWELDDLKTKTKNKAVTIKKMIAPKGYPAKELLKKKETFPVTADIGLNKCDSLAQLVSEYIQESETKDSLTELQDARKDSLISGKDAIIAMHESDNLNLSLLFRQSLQQQQKLDKENLRLHKRLKRQRTAGRLLSIGTAILSGVATYYITQ